MRLRRDRRLTALLLLALAVLLSGFGLAGVAQEPPPRPRLAVLVVFDQMRADYLTRWQDLYGEGGFRRLQTEGAWFQNCHYPYAHTVTAAGHASIATGCPPRRHGIIANDWYDRSRGETISAVRSDRYRPIPLPPDPTKDGQGSAPVLRREKTLGDALMEATGGKGRVVSLSIKDRAAILLAALRAFACYWFSTSTGDFVTSTYYTDQPQPWVLEFNKRRPADRWFGGAWDRLRPDLDYLKFSGPDDVPGEGIGYGQGRTFPHPFARDARKPNKDYYNAVTNSPEGNELLLALARRAIDAVKLGGNDVPDLLCLSFSCNDLIGHSWGPDSQEVFDVTLRSDLIVKDLLDYLDEKVGRGRYLFALSADHGVCPLPEVSRARGKDAGRIEPSLIKAQAQAFLNETFCKGKPALPWIEDASGPWIYLNHGVRRELKLDAAKGKPALPWIEDASGPWIYLNHGVRRELKLDAAKVEKTLAHWLSQQRGVQAAYTRGELSRGPLKDDPLGESVRQCFDPERCGDVFVIPRPYYQFTETKWVKATYATSHGTPHAYDTHVPLLVYGAGVPAGVYQERVSPLAIPAILAHGLGIRPPDGAEAPLPKSLKNWLRR
jgi:hypothetical protein